MYRSHLKNIVAFLAGDKSKDNNGNDDDHNTVDNAKGDDGALPSMQEEGETVLLTCMSNLGLILNGLGKVSPLFTTLKPFLSVFSHFCPMQRYEAEVLLRLAAARSRAAHGLYHPLSLLYTFNLAVVLTEAQKYATTLVLSLSLSHPE